MKMAIVIETAIIEATVIAPISIINRAVIIVVKSAIGIRGADISPAAIAIAACTGGKRNERQRRGDKEAFHNDLTSPPER
jgi:hypothetical protein